MRLQVGLYAVYLLDWLTVFSKEQFLVLRLEDHASNVSYTMHRVFQFLSLGTTVALQTHGAGLELRGRRPCEGLAESRADSVSWGGQAELGGHSAPVAQAPVARGVLCTMGSGIPGEAEMTSHVGACWALRARGHW